MLAMLLGRIVNVAMRIAPVFVYVMMFCRAWDVAVGVSFGWSLFLASNSRCTSVLVDRWAD